MKSDRIRCWVEKAIGCIRFIVRFRSGLRPSRHRTMKVKALNQISHNMRLKEQGHSTTTGSAARSCWDRSMSCWSSGQSGTTCTVQR